MPGERLAISDGVVWIDGQPLKESYVKSGAEPNSAAWRESEMLLGEAEYWVIGDNRRVTDFGRVPTRKIVGKALF